MHGNFRDIAISNTGRFILQGLFGLKPKTCLNDTPGILGRIFVVPFFKLKGLVLFFKLKGLVLFFKLKGLVPFFKLKYFFKKRRLLLVRKRRRCNR